MKGGLLAGEKSRREKTTRGNMTSEWNLGRGRGCFNFLAIEGSESILPGEDPYEAKKSPEISREDPYEYTQKRSLEVRGSLKKKGPFEDILQGTHGPWENLYSSGGKKTLKGEGGSTTIREVLS